MTATNTYDPSVLDTVRAAVTSASAEKVFGPPVHQNGVLLLPVAKVSGGGGGGGGRGPAEAGPEAGGSGGGLSLSARPLGVFVIKEGAVGWRPAVDVNKVILGGQIVAVTALLVLREFLKARARRDADC